MLENPVAGADYPERLEHLRAWFASDADCLDYLDWLRWPDGFTCPWCGAGRGPRVRDGLRRCARCRRRVSVTAGTVFQDTRTPLSVWFEAAWLMAVPANGVSALTLSRVLPVGSYQTAWTMLAKYRAAIHQAPKAKLSGTIEVDEWYHGGVHPGGDGLAGKNLVVAAVEHAPHGKGFGRVRFAVVPDRSAWQLRKAIRANIEPGSRIITDGLSAYVRATAGYVHEPRNESAPDAPPAHELLPGVHRVFSLCDRWLLGTHQGGVQSDHLPEYLSEFGFRWNRRHSRHRGLVFTRVIELALDCAPTTYRDLVRTAAPKAAHPTGHGPRRWPGTLAVAPVARPWRQPAPGPASSDTAADRLAA
jgi:transposase-like protein